MTHWYMAVPEKMYTAATNHRALVSLHTSVRGTKMYTNTVTKYRMESGMTEDVWKSSDCETWFCRLTIMLR